MTRYELSVYLPADGSEIPPTIVSTDPGGSAASKTRTLCPAVEATLGLLVARAFYLEEQLDALPPHVRASIPANIVLEILVHGGLVTNHLADEHGLPLSPDDPVLKIHGGN